MYFSPLLRRGVGGEVTLVQHFVNNNGMHFVLENNFPDFLAVERLFYFFVRAMIDDDLTVLSNALQALGRVHHISDNGIV